MDALPVFVHVGILVAMSSITPAQLKWAAQEAADVWKPYGVEVAWFGAAGNSGSENENLPPAVDVLLTVVTDESGSAARTAAAHPPLGGVLFDEGRPGRTIDLQYRRIEEIVLASHQGAWRVATLPSLLRDRVMGRALGRVLAHEIGHVLLAAPEHEPAGLMRPSFAPDDLVSPYRDHLRLSRADVTQLHTRNRLHTQ